MLRAYNAEADNSIRSLKLGNVVTAGRRLEASRVAIAKHEALMEMQISFRAANIRAGYVYVISNRGAFGQDVVKIGLTRRLETNRTHCRAQRSIRTIPSTNTSLPVRSTKPTPGRKFFFATPVEVRDVLTER